MQMLVILIIIIHTLLKQIIRYMNDLFICISFNKGRLIVVEWNLISWSKCIHDLPLSFIFVFSAGKRSRREWFVSRNGSSRHPFCKSVKSCSDVCGEYLKFFSGYEVVLRRGVCHLYHLFFSMCATPLGLYLIIDTA